MTHHVPTSFSPGPQPIEVGERDPDFRSRPIGFTAHLEPAAPAPACPYCRERGQHLATCRHARNDSLPVVPVDEPLLWDGDQA